MSSAETFEKDAAAIEAEISRTRQSLDRKLGEIERRLSPTHRLTRLRGRLEEIPVAPWGAVMAVAAGTWMAASGLRRHYFTHAEPDGAALGERVVLAEIGLVCD